MGLSGFLTSCPSFLGRRVVVISSYNLLNEVCDDKRFPKHVSGAVKEICNIVHDGLFTYVECHTPSRHIR